MRKAKKKIKPPQRRLVDAPPEKSFWVNNGLILKNVRELYTALKKMNKETFQHHVNKQKNDFSKWVREVLDDKQLADALEKATTKNEFIKKLKKAVS